jgi:hypothetical protein
MSEDRARRVWPSRMVSRLRRQLHDLRRVAAGLAAFVRYLVTRDPVETGLAQLAAESAVAVRGHQNRYRMTIASTRAEPQEVTLAVDIYVVESPTHPDGHYAYFVKHLKARPRASTRVEVVYDWHQQVDFLVDDRRSPPDDFWRGTLDRSARYSVNAVLSAPGGTRLERLTIYPQLTS